MAAKKDVIAAKGAVDKIDIPKLVNFPVYSKSLNIKVDVDESETFAIDLKKFKDVVDKDVVKNTVFNKLNSKVSESKAKITLTSTFIHKTQSDVDE